MTVNELDELLLGHLCDALDPDEAAQAETLLRTDTDARARYQRLRAMLPAIDAADDPAPPTDLVTRTLGLVAEHICKGAADRITAEAPALAETRRYTPDQLRYLSAMADGPTTGSGRWRRPDFLVAASIFVIAGCLLIAGTYRLRQHQLVQSCANNLRMIHGSLNDFASTNKGEYPRVNEEPPLDTASAFVPILRAAGTLGTEPKPVCPALPTEYKFQYYAYTLGYRVDDGALRGLRDGEEQAQFLPVLADRPTIFGGQITRGNSGEHRGGQNVLYVAGHVRFVTTTRAGLAGDDIYLNRDGFPNAGLTLSDTVLGIGSDHP